ncbi:unnamed protein product [Phaedon cochleariae]|uniref:G-protein coupled receptors family 1 profile domain-containing protein n=1 Tax=Phaedon cochleariae TaxID=80249 RepID=A0A9P0DPE9_PHACE|nr:unnamed protein product [Phaedon cochleariae]
MIFLVITYVVPILLMSICYTIMGTVLWGSRSIGEKTQRQIDAIRSKRKVVKMFILVVMIFGICWLPYHGYFIYVYFDTNVIFSRYTQHVYLGFYWFAMSNAMVNPLIYYWMNARFRKYFKSVICGWKTWFSTRDNEDTHPYEGHSHSFSKSGGNGTIRMRITSPRELDHRFRSTHSAAPNANNNGDALGSSHSSRWSNRSRSWNKKQQTTVDL